MAYIEVEKCPQEGCEGLVEIYVDDSEGFPGPEVEASCDTCGMVTIWEIEEVSYIIVKGYLRRKEE